MKISEEPCSYKNLCGDPSFDIPSWVNALRPPPNSQGFLAVFMVSPSVPAVPMSKFPFVIMIQVTQRKSFNSLSSLKTLLCVPLSCPETYSQRSACLCLSDCWNYRCTLPPPCKDAVFKLKYIMELEVRILWWFQCNVLMFSISIGNVLFFFLRQNLSM